jgi:hypothetical protein
MGIIKAGFMQGFVWKLPDRTPSSAAREIEKA